MQEIKLNMNIMKKKVHNSVKIKQIVMEVKKNEKKGLRKK